MSEETVDPQHVIPPQQDISLLNSQVEQKVRTELGESAAAMYQILINMAQEEQVRNGEVSEIYWDLTYTSTQLLERIRNEATNGKLRLAKEFLLTETDPHQLSWAVYTPEAKAATGYDKKRLRGFTELRYFVKPDLILFSENFDTPTVQSMLADLERVFGQIPFPVMVDDRSFEENKVTFENQAYKNAHQPPNSPAG
ncbi:hypothetical protein HYW55_06490 [Candidatus Gottesmanbacteria bacterium]|nr:hypothetical protein [Candidatus Gottesmanbacteria bacterium]